MRLLREGELDASGTLDTSSSTFKPNSHETLHSDGCPDGLGYAGVMDQLPAAHEGCWIYCHFAAMFLIYIFFPLNSQIYITNY